MTPEVEDIAKDDDEGFRQAEIERQEREHRHSITAIHEAGHAVACFMTAKLMGREPADALYYVEIYRPGNGAMTCGARWSKDISAAVKAAQCPEDSGDDAIAAAFAAGADSKSWLRAQLLIRVAGPVAQAKETGQSHDDLDDDDRMTTITTPSYDWNVHTDCTLAGISASEHQTHIDDAIAFVSAKFDDSELWDALTALANALPKEGRMEGRECWKIFSDAIETFEPWA
jgi:hypothetical protein